MWRYAAYESPQGLVLMEGRRSVLSCHLHFQNTTLGFTLYCTRNHRGNFKVGWRTDKSRLRRSLAKFHQLLQIIRHEPLKDQAEQINQVLRGHYAYYGIAGNVGSLL